MVTQTAQSPTVRGDELVEQVRAAGARLVDLQFSDIAGGVRAMTLPVDLLPSVLEHGYRFDGSAVTGGLRQVELDLFLVPDPSTLILYPEGSGGHRARLACSVHRRDGQPFAGNPRTVLERAVGRARAAGFEYVAAVELEYYLFRPGLGEVTADAAGYFGIGDEPGSATRDEIVTTLQAMGIAVGGAHHETGPGQEELDLLPVDALRMADQVLMVRQVIRSVAARHGLKANFMPKPQADAPGSGMHVFQQLHLVDGSGDALRGVDDDLSAVGRWAIAGLLERARGMSAVLCPSVNSYKRLSAGHRAPRHATWARFSQASLVRVPISGPSANSTIEIELRSPDNMANPYLALALALACMLDGIERGEEPPPPLDENLVRYDDEELGRLGMTRLPATLGEALDACAADLVVRDTLGEYVTDQFLQVKRAEWDDYRRHVSPWEHARYGE
ncbi:MAG: glutamine synthetase [Chloroflexia bacterium]|nr:glutamine synthetase [Chloroflexia bacterium]